MLLHEKFDHWSNGHGVIQHSKMTEQCVHDTLSSLQAQGAKPDDCPHRFPVMREGKKQDCPWDQKC